MENTDTEVLLDSTESQASSTDHNDSQKRTIALLDSIAFQASDTGHSNERTMLREPSNVWKVFRAKSHAVVQTLIGANVGVTLWFALKSTPISIFQLHVGLCVVGYQLLIAHGVLYLQSPGWSALNLKHRRRVHWNLQLGGALLATAGSALMIKKKTDDGRSHFTSIHAKLALAALVFTCTSLINGLLSLYVVELRHLIPEKLSKITKISHLILGTAAFASSSACLAFGYNKHIFVEWATQEFAYVMIGIVTVYTALIIALPLYKVSKRFGVRKIKIC